jgi:hypothetical protein
VYVALTVRKLKRGSYDDWREAWTIGSEERPEGFTNAYILRNLNDPDEIVAFGFFEGDLEALRGDPRFREIQQQRMEAMAPYVESVGADDIYEVIDEVSPPA